MTKGLSGIILFDTFTILYANASQLAYLSENGLSGFYAMGEIKFSYLLKCLHIYSWTLYIAEMISYSAYCENKFCFPGDPVKQHIFLLWGILRSKVWW